MANPIELLANGTLTGASSLVIRDLSLEYIKYQLVINRLIAVGTTDANLAMRTSTDNGASFLSTSGGYTYDLMRSAGSDGAGAHYPYATSDFMILINALSNTTNNFNGVIVDIFNAMSSTSLTTALSETAGQVNVFGSTTQVADTVSFRNVAEANNALQIICITNASVLYAFSMQYSLYGYRG